MEEEVEESSSCFAGYKALQIPCILQNIFVYLSHSDLKRARLVNRVFNDESNRILRKRSKIVLNSAKRLIGFNIEPFKNVHTFCDGFQLINMHVATPAMQIFLTNCGHSIKSLDLRDSKWTFMELKDILMEASPQLEELIIHGQLPKELWSVSGSMLHPRTTESAQQPSAPLLGYEGLGRMLLNNRPYVNMHNNHNNNETLRDRNNQVPHRTPHPGSPSIVGHSSSNKKVKEKKEIKEDERVLWLPKVKRVDLQLYDKLPEDDLLQDFVAKILTATKNLEILRSSESRKGKSRRERFHRILFETLIDPKFSIILPKLAKIDFSLTPWGEEQYQKLSLKYFPLTYLSLTILPDISTSTVVKLLTSFKSTLTKLKISFTNWQIMEFPNLELTRLRHLSLDWYNGSLKFITHLASLETLILAQVDLNEALRDELIDEDDDDDLEHQFISRRKHRFLSSFELYQPSGAEIFPESVRKLSFLFPNLKRLVVGKLTDHSLRAVFSSFPQLEEFSAIEGTYTDEGVTGISVQPCTVCDRQHLTELCRGMYNEVLISSQRNHSYIGDLKNLRKLELRAPNLTNLSVYHGILQCKRLRSLTLRSFHLTNGSLKRIVDTFTLDYLETTHTFSHKAEIKYAWRKMSGRTFILNGMEVPREYSRCSPRDMDYFIANFTPFIVVRPILHNSSSNSTPRPLRPLIGHIMDLLGHTQHHSQR